MPNPITKIVDDKAVVREIINVYAIIARLEKRVGELEAEVLALKSAP